MTVPPHIALTLLELRAKRDFIEKAISVLAQIWEGDEPPVAVVGNGHADPKPARRKTPKPERRAEPRKFKDNLLTTDAELVLKVLRGKAPMKPSDVMAAAKMNPARCAKVRGLLQRRGLLKVEGNARASRWSLAAGAPAKEGL